MINEIQISEFNLINHLSSESLAKEPRVGIVPHKSLLDTSLHQKKEKKKEKYENGESQKKGKMKEITESHRWDQSWHTESWGFQV